jgi:hypothetical protein
MQGWRYHHRTILDGSADFVPGYSFLLLPLDDVSPLSALYEQNPIIGRLLCVFDAAGGSEL